MPLITPDPQDLRRRVALSTAVRDTDAIEKVPDAGEIQDRDGERVQVMHNGLLIHEACYGGDFMTEIIRDLRGHHEAQEEFVFHQLLQRLAETREDRAPVMIELGAFWAYYSMWFAKALPGARTIMVEPDPNNLVVGQRNFALNDLQGDWVEAAVGFDDGGEIALQCESDNRVRTVPTASIGGLLDRYQLPKCDLLLCDTQGAELGVLEAAADALRAGRVRFLTISTHHHIFSGDPLTHQRCLALLEDLGAHIIAEHSITESCSGDGLIAASMDERDRDFVVPVSHVRAKDSLFGEPEYALAAARGWRGPARHYGGRVVRRAQRTIGRLR